MDILAHFSELKLRIKELEMRERIGKEANDAMKARAETAERLLVEAADVLDDFIVSPSGTQPFGEPNDNDAARHLVRTMRRVGNREPATVNPVIAAVAQAHRDVYAPKHEESAL